VAILDFDVHQGNGTIDIFHHDPRVLMCSSFQHPFYPYKHYHNMPDHVVNVMLKPGTDSAAYRQAVTEGWLDALDRFKPQLILVSAGFDAHRLDPLADIELETEDYRWITDTITTIAKTHCRGRVISMLEGATTCRFWLTGSRPMCGACWRQATPQSEALPLDAVRKRSLKSFSMVPSSCIALSASAMRFRS